MNGVTVLGDESGVGGVTVLGGESGVLCVFIQYIHNWCCRREWV